MGVAMEDKDEGEILSDDEEEEMEVGGGQQKKGSKQGMR